MLTVAGRGGSGYCQCKYLCTTCLSKQALHNSFKMRRSLTLFFLLSKSYHLKEWGRVWKHHQTKGWRGARAVPNTADRQRVLADPIQKVHQILLSSTAHPPSNCLFWSGSPGHPSPLPFVLFRISIKRHLTTNPPKRDLVAMQTVYYTGSLLVHCDSTKATKKRLSALRCSSCSPPMGRRRLWQAVF